ncbi:unnamed protein product [Candidula unifasciata]|uniref:nucleoside-diphosphate kinase n=1 Tax=Candidula unifasciata TaxID=100452 RepID=A0A8S3ZTJ2_9EUPU|nr:unnamed protein product [Candidula unifasciata]
MADPRCEHTFLAVKPDGVQGGLVVESSVVLTSNLLHNHYTELSSKIFFPGLMEYMSAGPVFAMVWEGTNVPSMGKKMLGATKPRESPTGTIQGDFAVDVGLNICHGKKIALWVNPD